MSPTELRVAGFPIEFRYSAIALFRKLDPTSDFPHSISNRRLASCLDRSVISGCTQVILREMAIYPNSMP